MNTSCRATYKNGRTEDFNSIEEASDRTGLTIASIKIRCNKVGASGKDGTTFEWLDDYTRRHYLAKRSKTKGSNWESEIVKCLKEIGYANVCRSAGESKKLDAMKVDIADPSGELPVAIQAKNTQNCPNYFTLRDSCGDSRDFILMWKKASEGGSASPGSVAILSTELFYKLLKLYRDANL